MDMYAFWNGTIQMEATYQKMWEWVRLGVGEGMEIIISPAKGKSHYFPQGLHLTALWTAYLHPAPLAQGLMFRIVVMKMRALLRMKLDDECERQITDPESKYTVIWSSFNEW